MSQTNQSRQYADEEGPPRRRVSSPWKFSPAPRKTSKISPERVSPHRFSHRRFARRICVASRGSPMRPREGLAGVGHLPRRCSDRVPRSAVRTIRILRPVEVVDHTLFSTLRLSK